jgi:YYY domain-containing protein
MISDLSEFVSWYLVTAAAGLLALPLTFRAFRWLPDRGYSLSKLVGILIPGYIFWLLGSLGFTYNDTGGMLVGVLMTAGVGIAWLGRTGISEMLAWMRDQRMTILTIELLFLAAFALWAWVRANIPDIEGTEKPMEFMFINSILRSPTLPPHDAWLSEHAIGYYYFGYLLVACLTRLTGAPPAVAFNLGIALLFALTAVAAQGIAMNLIAVVKGHSKRLLESFWPALLAPLLVLLAGNYYGPLELIHNNGWLRDTRIPAVYYDFGERSSDSPVQSLADFNRQPGARAGMINLWEWLDLKQINEPPRPNPGGFRVDLPNWFFAARVVHDRNLIGSVEEAIDENPTFSFLLADMHPHVLALPFVILAAALAFDWLLWARARGLPEGAFRKMLIQSWTDLLFAAAILGGLAFLNTWDFPIYLFLTVIALAFGLGLAQGWKGLVTSSKQVLLLALTLAVGSVLLYLPFYLTLQSQAGGIVPNLIYPTRFHQMVVHFGPVMAGMVVFLVWSWRRWRGAFDRRAAWWAAAGVTLALVLPILVIAPLIPALPGIASQLERFIFPLNWKEALSLFWQRRLIDSLSTIFPAVVIGLAAGLAVGALRQHDRQAAQASRVVEAEKKARLQDGQSGSSIVMEAAAPASTAEENPPENAANPETAAQNSPEGIPESASPAVLMTLGMVLTGALLMLGPEYVYLRDYFGTRMNTIFKFYFQVWTLWAIAGAFGLWYVSQHARSWAGRLAVSLVLLAILPGLVYLPGSLYSRTAGFSRSLSLDGMAYFARNYPDDYAAIEWLQENIVGRPVILEGTRGSYWIEGRSSRISMATGLPTLMGWIGHEQQWRGEYYAQVAGRPGDIQQIYQSRSWIETRQLLDKYKIEYVIVSPLERSWYDPIYLPKFQIYMDLVFEQGSTYIYHYREASLHPSRTD